MIGRALDGAAGSLGEIAADAGVSYDTLYAWKTGRRNPTPENLARLAEALDRRGEELRDLARELREAAGE